MADDESWVIRFNLLAARERRTERKVVRFDIRLTDGQHIQGLVAANQRLYCQVIGTWMLQSKSKVELQATGR